MSFHRPLFNALPALLLLGGTAVWAQQTDASAPEEFEQARYQSTYNTQRHPAFPALGSGLNSLTPGADTMFTFSLTGHWGKRLA